MNLLKSIQNLHSRAQAEKIADYIGDDQERFDRLMEIFLNGTFREAHFASWPMGVAAEKHPDLIKPWLNKMLDNLKKPVHDSVKRNTVRIMQDIRIPKKLQGKATDICFTFLANPSEAVAIKVFSMSVLLNITMEEPALKNELKVLIEDQMPYSSAAFRSRGVKVLKKLEKVSA